jgi:putative hydrolase of the HAD superfamily
MKATPITTIFTDIGGVLLTNGWDHHARLLATKTFAFDFEEMESVHRLFSDTYELGKITLDEYLRRVVFYRKRSFTRDQFIEFMYAQSRPYSAMLDLVKKLKEQHRLKVVAVNNEGREINDYRIRHFHLGELIDFFVSSCTLHVRKPDEEIFRLALQLAQVIPQEVVYLEDRLLFVQIAEELGIRSIHHTDIESTQAKLAEMGLSVEHGTLYVPE